MENVLSGHWVNDLVQIVTAIGMIMTAISSIVNRRKIGSIDVKVDQVNIVASKTVAQTQEVKEAVAEVKEIIKNGKNGSH